MAMATDLAVGTININGDLHGSTDPFVPELTPTGVAPGDYLGATLAIDQKGRILDAANPELDDFDCATETTCGPVIVGDNISVGSGIISLPLATTTNFGVVKVGTGLKVTSGLIERGFPIATETVLGNVIVPTSGNIDVDGSGNISIPLATESNVGLMQLGAGLIDSGGTVIPDMASLTPAANGVVGVVTLGPNIEVTGSEIFTNVADVGVSGVVSIGSGFNVTAGDISVTDIATTSTLGLVSIGSGLGVDVNGVLSMGGGVATAVSTGLVSVGDNIDVDAFGEISIPSATSNPGVAFFGTGLSVSTSTLYLRVPGVDVGGIKVGDGFSIDGSGVLSADIPSATAVSTGLVSVGSNLNVDVAGEITTNIATSGSLGLVSVGSNLNVDGSGNISVPVATNSNLGVIQSADTNNITVVVIDIGTDIPVVVGDMDIGTNIPTLDTNNVYTKAQTSSLTTIPYGAVITPDFSLSNVFEITLTGNTNINPPTNATEGTQYTIIIKQDAVGGHTATFTLAYKFQTLPTITSTANAVDMVTCINYNPLATEYYCQHGADFK